MFVTLLVAAHLSVNAAAGTLTLAWDPNPPEDDVHHYVVSRAATCPGNPDTVAWTDPRDVGNVTQFTYPDGVLDLTKRQCFTVQAVNAIGQMSGYAMPAEYVPDTQPTDQCAIPLGVKAVQLFPGRIVTTTGSVGSRINLQFQISSPNSAVIRVWVYNGAETSRQVDGTQLEDVGSVWFRAPLVPGTYQVVLNALNAAGCHAIATKGADGRPLTITVK